MFSPIIKNGLVNANFNHPVMEDLVLRGLCTFVSLQTRVPSQHERLHRGEQQGGCELGVCGGYQLHSGPLGLCYLLKRPQKSLLWPLQLI